MEVKHIGIDKIKVSKSNTRKDLSAGTEDATLDDLARSILEKGLLSPILVIKKSEGKYDLIAGQRRFLACKKLGWKDIPAIVRDDLNDADATVISLIENIHRADMNPLDKATALKALYEKYQDYSKVASETAWSEATVRKYVRLLDLPVELQQKLTTTEGPVKISAMSRLAQTFSDGDDAIEVYKRISGFNGTIQEEILKQSKGEVELIDELVDQAQEGAFDTRRCGGRFGCELIEGTIEGKLTQQGFSDLVKDIAIKVRTKVDKIELREAARSFWKMLSNK